MPYVPAKTSRYLLSPNRFGASAASAVFHERRHGEEVLRNDAVRGSVSENKFNSSNHYIRAPSREEGKFGKQAVAPDLNLPTAMKRNITSRCSRDRRDSQVMKPPTELVAKKPNFRLWCMGQTA